MSNTTVRTTIHVDDSTAFNMTIRRVGDHDVSVLSINYNDDAISTVDFFFDGTPRDVVLLLTNRLRQLKKEHRIVSSDEYDGITETNAILDDPDAMDAIAEGLNDLTNNNMEEM